MPRTRKTQPLTPTPVVVDAIRASTALIAPTPTPRTRTLIRAVAGDERDAALEAAESVINERAAALEAAGAQVISISTQVLYLERHTHWQVVVTIVYREGTNASS